MSLKIAIVVHGRFHAFDMARELIGRGHQVELFTNYPAYYVRRFGVPGDCVHSLISHGAAARAAWKLRDKGWKGYPEARLHTWFGRWAANRIRRSARDVVLCWSGVGEEPFRAVEDTAALRICQRGSAHIRVQARLLEEETARTGVMQDMPSPWMIEREEREYDLADINLLPSTFARRTFLEMGIDKARIATIPLAVDMRTFRPSQAIIEKRLQRIRSGAPLHILNAGTFSFQKGAFDMQAVVKALASDRFRFHFVGPVMQECSEIVHQMKSAAVFIPNQPQHKLLDFYNRSDIFWLPSVQDGFAMVLTQAMAAGLPLLATENSGGPDLIAPDETGWILPVRTPEAFIERLKWCDAHRDALADMVLAVYNTFQPRDWSDVAADFEAVCKDHLPGKRQSGRP